MFEQAIDVNGIVNKYQRQTTQ